MIASLRGTVLHASGGRAVIETGGVGFAVSLTPEHVLSLRIGEEARIHTSLIVRDDSFQLFGFVDSDRLSVFELLLTVNGVGPKSAQGVLAVLGPEQIADAIAQENDAPFRAVSGIGPKTAKLIVVTLAGKLPVFRNSPVAPGVHAHASSTRDSVAVALVGLGWPERTARDAIDDVLAALTETEQPTTPELLRLALSRLGPARHEES